MFRNYQFLDRKRGYCHHFTPNNSLKDNTPFLNIMSQENTYTVPLNVSS